MTPARDNRRRVYAPLALSSLAVLLMLGACSSSPPRSVPDQSSQSAGRSPAKPGGYYKDDGPGENPPDLDRIVDAQPRAERPHRFANNPYQVFGRDYLPLRTNAGFRERGMASWYGRRYHGQKTSTGEIYDMYSMTAAHPTLPVPSYVRVTSAATGKAVIVRVNDRGPFLSNRVIDLSYVAAHKLGYIQAGSALVDVEAISLGSDTLEISPRPPVQVSPPVLQSVLLPSTVDASGVYLQLGAFSVRDNAETFRAKIYKDLDWLINSIRIDPQGGLFRLRIGPYRSQDEARLMAESIRAQLNLQPVLLVK